MLLKSRWYWLPVFQQVGVTTVVSSGPVNFQRKVLWGHCAAWSVAEKFSEIKFDSLIYIPRLFRVFTKGFLYSYYLISFKITYFNMLHCILRVFARVFFFLGVFSYQSHGSRRTVPNNWQEKRDRSLSHFVAGTVTPAMCTKATLTETNKKWFNWKRFIVFIIYPSG